MLKSHDLFLRRMLVGNLAVGELEPHARCGLQDRRRHRVDDGDVDPVIHQGHAQALRHGLHPRAAEDQRVGAVLLDGGDRGVHQSPERATGIIEVQVGDGHVNRSHRRELAAPKAIQVQLVFEECGEVLQRRQDTKVFAELGRQVERRLARAQHRNVQLLPQSLHARVGHAGDDDGVGAGLLSRQAVLDHAGEAECFVETAFDRFRPPRELGLGDLDPVLLEMAKVLVDCRISCNRIDDMNMNQDAE